MTILASYDWESDSFSHHDDHAARQAWRDAVSTIAAKAHTALPECNGRVDSAVKIVLSNDVELLADGTAKVASQSNGATTYHVVNGECTCKDFVKAPHNFCKHRLSVAIQKRANALVNAGLSTAVEPPAASTDVQADSTPAVAPVTLSTAPPSGIAAEHIVEIQGKRFVKFCGLLALAHARGLVSLTVDWTYNDATLSLAKAVAVFPFGRFEESGDASPDNVTKKVAPHFRRVALTRASARALRNALNIDMVSLEELAE